MSRLYLSLWMAFIATALACLMAAAAAFHFTGDSEEEDSQKHRTLAGLAALLYDTLPATTDPRFEEQLKAKASDLSLDLLIWSKEKRLLAHTTAETVAFPEHRHRQFFRAAGAAGVVQRLPDGRWIGVLFPHFRPGRKSFFHLLLALVAVITAVGCYPLARSITRRLEGLEQSVRHWGKGKWSTRALVQGRDEVARLAERFNEAAEQTEKLILQQRRVLASASHELRSPLARLRMAVELMPEAGAERRRQLATACEQDVGELDGLIEDLLLTARADAASQVAFELVDLRLLVQTEADRFGAQTQLEALQVRGNRRMLTSLLRNLLDNARRHAAGAQVCVRLSSVKGQALLTVEDRGPGVAPEECDRIFEPFYRPPGHDESIDGGVGLGLSLVREIARCHGGDAQYEPRGDGGSRFVVRLGLSNSQ